jgi:uncharacterized surface protein with fasciclin (FAS1) repeats
MENLAFSRTLKAAAVALVASAITAPAAVAQITRPCIDTLMGLPEFSQFVNGVVHTRLVQNLRGAQSITMFVPTNEAVSRMHPGLRQVLLPLNHEGQQTIGSAAQTAIAAHVVQGRHDSRELAQGQQMSTYGETQITSAAEGGVLTLKAPGGAEARVVRPDIACSNGIIHGIDALLVR